MVKLSQYVRSKLRPVKKKKLGQKGHLTILLAMSQQRRSDQLKGLPEGKSFQGGIIPLESASNQNGWQGE